MHENFLQITKMINQHSITKIKNIAKFHKRLQNLSVNFSFIWKGYSLHTPVHPTNSQCPQTEQYNPNNTSTNVHLSLVLHTSVALFRHFLSVCTALGHYFDQSYYYDYVWSCFNIIIIHTLIYFNLYFLCHYHTHLHLHASCRAFGFRSTSNTH